MKAIKIVFGLLIPVFIAGCNSQNTQSSADTDSSMIAKDNTQAITTGDVTPSVVATSGDSNASSPGTTTDTSSARMNIAKPDPSKKGKKGKVSISMINPAKGDMAADNEGFYNNPEVLPIFPGGEKELEKFFSNNIQYPAEASDNGIDGTVTVSFAVDENGNVSSPKTMGNKIGYGLEQEAVRVFNKMPKWTPGKVKGKNVKTRYVLPVRFELQ